MEMVTNRAEGLFPKPSEIKMRCSCPDSAGMCKHLAAVMYGVGNRLDASPELLFVLRGVDHLELIEQAIPAAPISSRTGAATISSEDLGAIFDIEIGDAPAPTPAPKSKAPKKAAVKQASAPKSKAVVNPAVSSKASTKVAPKSAFKKAVAPKGSTKVAAKPVAKKIGAPKASAKPASKPAATRALVAKVKAKKKRT